MSALPHDDDYNSDEDDDYVPPADDELPSEDEVDLKFRESPEKELKISESQLKAAEDDWDDFLNSSDDPKKTESKPSPSNTQTDSSNASTDDVKPSPDEPSSTTSTSETSKPDRKRKIVETFDFFGEEVTREREVDEKTAAEFEAKKARQEAAKKSTPKTVVVGGLDAVLKKNATKKQNMTIFDKTGLDWNKYVKADEKLKTSLEQYGKSTANVLDKLNFIKK
uniref:Craniofacial development protein 1 n=1 Tax=Panagrellus redivivus TaxID=6233 RepID=A0A7E4VXN7_PANRE